MLCHLGTAYATTTSRTATATTSRPGESEANGQPPDSGEQAAEKAMPFLQGWRYAKPRDTYQALVWPGGG